MVRRASLPRSPDCDTIELDGTTRRGMCCRWAEAVGVLELTVSQSVGVRPVRNARQLACMRRIYSQVVVWLVYASVFFVLRVALSIVISRSWPSRSEMADYSLVSAIAGGVMCIPARFFPFLTITQETTQGATGGDGSEDAGASTSDESKTTLIQDREESPHQ